MRKRLLLLTALTNLLVLLLLSLAVAPLTKPEVTKRLEESMQNSMVAFGTFVLQPTPPTVQQVQDLVTNLDTSPDFRLGALSRRDQIVMGSGGDDMRRFLERDPRPRSTDRLGTLAPRCFDTPAGRVCSLGITDSRSDFWAINGLIPNTVISTQVREHWIRLGAIGVAAILVSLVGAVFVAHRLTRPIRQVRAFAEELGAGNLRARPTFTGPPEIASLGDTLTQLASRVDRLLHAERDRSAMLSHRLRTPLTVLRLEVGRLKPLLKSHPKQDERLARAVLNLERGLDDLIRESQLARDEAELELADVGQVLAEHLAPWSEAALAQGRRMTQTIPDEALLVRLTKKDLASVLDALISNIFRHTPASNGFRIDVTTETTDRRYVNIVVADSGNAGAGLIPAEGTGSTGIGLDLARRLVQNAGGLFDVDHDPRSGFRVKVQLAVAPDE